MRHLKKRTVKIMTVFSAFLVALSVMFSLMQPGIALAGSEVESDPNADVEDSTVWEASFAGSGYTEAENWNQAVTAIAESQEGYTESTKNFNEENKGYTRYGAWASTDTEDKRYNDWNTLFVQFVLHYAGVNTDYFPVQDNVQTWIESLTNTGLYTTEYTTGDLVFINKDGNTSVGIIDIINQDEQGNNTSITVIEGDSNDKVEENTYALDSNILGYGSLSTAYSNYQLDLQNQQGGETTEPLEEQENQDQQYSENTDESNIMTIDDTIDEGVSLNVTSGTTEGKNGQTLYINVNSTNSHPNDTDTPEVLRVDLSALPDGVVLAGFKDGKMTVGYESGTTKGTIEVVLHENADGTKYVTYTQPAGSTINFVLQFNSTNGTMDKTNTVTATPSIENKQDNDKVTVDGDATKTSKTITWTGVNTWNNLYKTVDHNELTINGTTNKLEGNLTYTIGAQEQNADGTNDTGSIWTDKVVLTDTLTLPDGMTFPTDATVSGDKIVDGQGNTLFSFDTSNATNKQSVSITNINLSPDKNSVTYTITYTNTNKNSDGTYAGEMDSINNLKANLDASKLVLNNSYKNMSAEELKQKKIKNNVHIETTAVKGTDSYTDDKSVDTTPKKDEKFTVSKSATQNGSSVADKNVKPGSTIKYTITVTNTGTSALPAKDSNGNAYTITDSLPGQLTLTDAQIQAIQNMGGTVTYEQWNKYYTVSFPQSSEIAVGSTWSITFDATVKDETTLVSEGKGNEIYNSAQYRGQYGKVTTYVEKTKINLTKTVDKDSAKNGDVLTYTITIENPNDTATTFDEVLSDTLNNNLELQGMYDSNGNQIIVNQDGTYSIDGHQVTLTQNGQNLSWNVGTLAAHEKITIIYKCKVNYQSGTTISNSVSTNHGEKGDSGNTTITPPTSVDKKVKASTETDWTDGNTSYDNGTILDYKISIQNSSGEDASTKTNHVLTDKIQGGLLLNIDKLYTLNRQASYDNGEVTTNDLVESSQTLSAFLDKSNGDWTVYYAIINGEIVQISKINDEHATSTSYGTQLKWYIGSLEPGQTVEKTYQVTLNMADCESKGTSYKNTVTEGSTSKTVTVQGNKEEPVVPTEAKADIRKNVWTIANYNGVDWGVMNKLNNKTYYSTTDGITKYVVYSITVANTGTETINVKKITDEYGSKLTYKGISAVLDNIALYQFGDNITVTHGNVQGWLDLSSSTFVSNANIKLANNDTTNHVATYQVGGDDGVNIEAGKNLSFFVLCKVNDDVSENDLITNTAKLYVDEDVEYGAYGKIKTKGTADDAYQNNGDSQDEGVTDGERVISSSVTVIPKNSIIPGIKKEATGYVASGKTIDSMTAITSENKKTNIMPNSTVKWEVTLYNDGTVPVEDYTISDSVESPFHIMTQSEANDIGITDSASILKNKVFVLEVYDSKKNLLKTVDLSSTIWNQIKDGTDNEYSDSFSVDITQSMGASIPAGGYAKLTVYTNCVQQTFTIYENTATFSPKENFDGTDVTTGQVVEDETGKVTGVKASDSVYAMGDYGSFSWKTIAEEDDPTNNAVGYDTSNNYIVIDKEDTNKKVVYTNNIENVSSHDYECLTIVDLMPFVGDTGVLNQSQTRDSEFTVGYNGELTLTVKDSSGNVRTLTEGTDYYIKFSSKTSFSEDDLKNGESDSSWHDTWSDGDKSFRIVMSSEFKLLSNETLTMQYEGLIGNDAQPGQIAWNSFGYAYDVTGASRLRAEPPKVGVKIRKSPTITKKVVDDEGKDLGYNESNTFSFKVYEGETVDESTYKTSFTVIQGESKKFNTILDSEGNKVFKSGKTYTIVEDTTSAYTFQSVQGSTDDQASNVNQYTFTYSDALESYNITFTNKLNEYELPSTGGTGTLSYYFCGTAIMSIAILLYAYIQRRNRTRRNS